MPLENDMPPGVLRQRRNLLILCLIIVFYKMAGVEFDSASSLVNATPLGISIGIKNTSSIFWGLLGLTVYFWVRYIQYFFKYVCFDFFNYLKEIYCLMLERYMIKNNYISAGEKEDFNQYTKQLKNETLLLKSSTINIPVAKKVGWVLMTGLKFLIVDPYVLNYWMPLILPIPLVIYFLS